MNHFDGLDHDPLAAMFNAAPTGNPANPVKQPPASYTAPEHREPCGKCRGTGQTRWGVCFRCNGKGGKTFKISATERAQARTKRVERKARTAAEAIEAFKAEHPDVWVWMDGSTFGFAVSLRDAVAKYGSLTENQLAAARRCIEKFNAAKTARADRQANAPAIEIAAIEQAFERATAAGLKRPRLTIANFTFSKAPAHGKNAGSIYVRDGYAYMGKVTAGKFHAIRECGAEREAEIIRIAADPKSAAIAHGRQFGVCAVCRRELTDPNSIAAGIGPVCATRMGW